MATGFSNWGAYSPSGHQLASVVNRRVQVWDPTDGHLIAQKEVPGVRHAEAAAFNAGGSWIVVADRHGTVQAVDAVTLAPVGEQVTVGHDLADLVPVPGSTGVVALLDGGEDPDEPRYALVDPATGRVDLGALGGPDPWGYAAVSPDGRRLAVTQEGLAGLVDLRTGRWISAPVEAHGPIATRVAFNGDGSRFVTSGFDGGVVLWDGLTGERLAAVRPLGPEFETGVAFLPDGHTAHIATSNGQMFRWDTDPRAWTAYACRLAGRNLDADEWRAVFGSEVYRKTCAEWPLGDDIVVAP